MSDVEATIRTTEISPDGKIAKKHHGPKIYRILFDNGIHWDVKLKARPIWTEQQLVLQPTDDEGELWVVAQKVTAIREAK